MVAICHHIDHNKSCSFKRVFIDDQSRISPDYYSFLSIVILLVCSLSFMKKVIDSINESPTLRRESFSRLGQ